MHGGSRILAVLFLLSLASTSMLVVVASIYYPEWSTIYGGGGYSTLEARSIESDFYDEFIYVTAWLNNTSSNNLDIGVVAYYLNGTMAWNFTLDILGNDYVGGCFPDPTSDYLLVTGYFWDWYYTSTWDGVVIRINRTNPNDWNGILFDSGHHDFLYSTYVGGDGSVYVVGELYNGSWYYGLIIRYDNYSFSNGTWTAYTTRSYNVTFYDATIGPDGYLYITGHTLYRYSNGSKTYYIPIHQFIYKLNPINLSLVNTTYIYLPTGSYVNVVNTMKVDIATCGNGICVAGFYYDNATGNDTNPTLGAFVAKYDTSFNLLWRRNIATTEYEVFHGLTVDGTGNIVAVGKTSNDYGSGLGNTYYHILIVVLDENGDLKDAFMAGGDNGDIALDAAIDFNGNTYIAGVQYSTTLTFYNITGNITIASTPRLPGILSNQPTIPAIKAPSTATVTENTAIKTIGAEPIDTSRIVSLKTLAPTSNKASIEARPPTDTIITPQQVSGEDRALIVSLGYYLSPNAIPPTPIPEPSIIALIMVAVAIAAYYYLRRME